MISIQKVTKNYGNKVAVDGLDLEIPEGELFAFLGPNGAGKTTTIKMICGLARPTQGVVTVAGHDMTTDYLSAKHLLAYVPDQPYMYDKLSGREFMEFTADLYAVEEGEKQEEMARLIELFGMHDWIDNLSESYSHGMKQRVVLSAALLHKPKVIVVDEPLVGLDPQTSRIVRDIFREQTENGVTIFMSTHVISIAEEVASRIGILYHGNLIGLGAMEEFRARVPEAKTLEEIFFHVVQEYEEGLKVS